MGWAIRKSVQVITAGCLSSALAIGGLGTKPIATAEEAANAKARGAATKAPGTNTAAISIAGSSTKKPKDAKQGKQELKPLPVSEPVLLSDNESQPQAKESTAKKSTDGKTPGFISMDQGAFHLASTMRQPDPSTSFQPSTSVDPSMPVQPPSFNGLDSGYGSGLGLDRGLPSTPSTATVVTTPAAGGSNDVVNNLVEGRGAPIVEAQRRSPISFDPNIRGFRGGQLYTQANGANWISARPDLDSVLSKLDSNNIQDIVVIAGPYGLRYGPGFAFIDLSTAPTPRYDGYQTHYRASTNYRANGAQLYTREEMSGGDRDFGYRISSGQARGNDYYSGSPGLTKIPASYRYTDVNAEFGYNLGDNTRLEFGAMRLDQGNTDYAAQFFDLGYLSTNGYTLRLIDEDVTSPWSRAAFEGFYNDTRYAGDNANKRDPNFPVVQRIEEAVDAFAPAIAPGQQPTRINATTSGVQTASGFRNVYTFGEVQDSFINFGVDGRFIGQRIQENFNVTPFIPQPNGKLPQSFATSLPPGQSSDIGTFTEMNVAVTPYLTTTIGGRADWAQTVASGLRPGSVLPADATSPRNDLLYAFYLKNSLELDQTWTLNAAVGHAQRNPTLIERYGDGLFLGVLQSGFTRVVGTPDLKKERNWQADLGLNAEYEDFRGRLSGYHSWVINYITYAGSPVINPVLNDARLVQYVNTGKPAQLFGFEAWGEYDLADQISVYSSMRFNRGYNTELNAALPGIFPLDSALGIRFHDVADRQWSVDTFVRIVNTQDRLGVIYLPANLPPGVNPQAESRTPGFTVWNIRANRMVTPNLMLTGGIDNILNRSYQGHLDLRLTSSVNNLPITRVLAPGFSPYMGMNYTF